MRRLVSTSEALWVCLLKAAILAGASVGFLYQMAGIPTLISTATSVFLISLLSYFLARKALRLPWVFVFSTLLIFNAFLSFFLILNHSSIPSPATSINWAQSTFFVSLSSSIVFVTRSLSQRWRWANVMELALVVAVVVFIFFSHRDFNLSAPRFFADWAFSEGYDPIVILRGIGIVLALFSLLLMLRRTHVIKLLISLILLVLLGLGAYYFIESVRIPAKVENPVANALGEDQSKDSDEQSKSDGEKGDKENKGGSGGNNGESSSNSKPQPVAIAVFYDEFSPADGYFHFRQNVLSLYNGNHLTSSSIDEDVITNFPLNAALVANTSQDPSTHFEVNTSMYLVHDHPSPPQLSHAIEIASVLNPDPKLFVAAYSVKSLGMTTDISRMVGKRSIPADWSEEKRSHYLSIPDDPRYKALSDIIVRGIDLRFAGDDIVKALSIRAWLEKEGYYTLNTTHIDRDDPTASFLFGSLRGYCVHFAHAAVFLLRSQGIAARVALGYAVDNRLRGSNSAVLILSDQAHAWPEIYVDGIGWVTFDIAPESGDVQPRPFVDQDLESLFGELARNDKSGGKSAKPKDSRLQIPWKMIAATLAWIFLGLLVLSYIIKFYRIFAGIFIKSTSKIHLVTISCLDTLAMFGKGRHYGESLEAHAKRVEIGDYQRLISLHSTMKMGGGKSVDIVESKYLGSKVRKEAVKSVAWWRVLLGILNPISWLRLNH